MCTRCTLGSVHGNKGAVKSTCDMGVWRQESIQCWEECEQDLDARLERAASTTNVSKQRIANFLL